MKSTLAYIGLCAVAVVLQVSVFAPWAWNGIAADLVLLMVVAVGHARGGTYAALCGFGAGLLLDLVPPSTDETGRWAMAMIAVALLASAIKPTSRRSMIATAAVCSFVGTSVYALIGVVLGDHMPSFGSMLGAILIGVLWDSAVAALLMPRLVGLFTRLQPRRV